MNYDFSGYATRNNLKCSDGRTILRDAFKDNDGMKVPLVYQHVHDDPSNVLGHAVLENRENGVYAYCSLNDTDSADRVRELIKHGDINALSIYANQLIQNGSDVVHGNIREVSVVLSGANPGAFIDNLNLVHSDGSYGTVDDEAVIYSGLEFSHGDTMDEEKEENVSSPKDDQGDQTVGEIYDAMTDAEKAVVAFLIEEALKRQESDSPKGDEDKKEEQPKDKKEPENAVEHSSIGGTMSRNVFDRTAERSNDTHELTHSEFSAIVETAKKVGSLKEAFLQHAEDENATYGIEHIDYLFPDAVAETTSPTLYGRKMEWVASVINGASHSPFSRIKTTVADITADEARARGYIKGKQKKDEVIKLLKRVTNPTTIYKKQKLDRDDIVDITDMDVVAFLKSEMRLMLDEEIARAVLVGDGREEESDDKISEEAIRPIAKDDDLYAIKVELENTANPSGIENGILRARKDYRGSGTPTLFASPDVITDLLLQKDQNGRRIYKTEQELAAALRVSNVVEVPLLSGQKIDDKELIGIVVNMADYKIGADKGGEINMFDDFDIDYNQYKYLIETRISGTLVSPKTAIVITKKAAGGVGA